MKKIFFIIALMVCSNINAQQWYSQQIPNSTQHDNSTIRSIFFLNADTGWLITGKDNSTEPARIYKTTDKGRNWNLQNDFGITAQPKSGFFDVKFLNQNTGYAICGSSYDGKSHPFLYKTTNSGFNWSQVSDLSSGPGPSDFPKDGEMKIINESTVLTYRNIGAIGSVFKTTNSGQSWNLKYSAIGYLKGIETSKVNQDVIYIYGSKRDEKPLILKTDNAMETYSMISDGTGYDVYGGILSLSVVKNGDFDNLFFSLYTSKFFKTDNNYNASQVSIGLSFTRMHFINSNLGILAGSINTYITTNGGASFNLESSINDDPDYLIAESFNAIDQIVYLSSTQHPGKIFIRELSTQIGTYYNNQSAASNVFIDGTNYSSGTSFIRGGTLNYCSVSSIDSAASNEKIFYKWSDGNTFFTRNNYYTSPGSIENYYKTKNLSTDNTAISKSSSTKSVKEAHGYIDRIHTSMGGVFFSRSTNNGSSFSREEVVNKMNYVSNNNINPHLAEVKTPLSGGVDAGKNSAAIWETRDGNNINIMYSQREVIGSVGVWAVNQVGISGSNSFSVDVTGYPNFQCLPKLSVIKGSSVNDIYYTVINYLEPDGSNTKLMARVHIPGQAPFDYQIATGNIADFSTHSTSATGTTAHEIHYAYKKDQDIYYKKMWYGLSMPSVSATDFKISGGDGNISFRYSPDISLRNGYPIITYQGQHQLTREYSIENPLTGVPAPNSISLNMHPIIVRWANSNGWNGNIMTYNSDGINTQQNPDIEGCTTGNSYVLAYSKNHTQFKHVVKGDNLGNYYCNPNTFSGTDEKLVSGSYTSPTGGVSRATLTQSSSLYTLGQGNIDIDNSNLPVYDNAYSNVKGVVDMNNTYYTFNLGPIITKTSVESLFSDIFLPPEMIPVTTSTDFNEYMTSDILSLKNEDTLILGTMACHSKPGGTYEPLVYRVNLIDADDVIVRELFVDTVTYEEETMVESYKGFIMDNIDGTQQFRVQLKLEDLNARDAKFTFSGVYDGDEASARGIDLTKGIYVDYGRGAGHNNNQSVKPTEYVLAQNYPNPFNPSTTINYSIPSDGLVQIKIYDITGKEVMSLLNENKTAGNYEVQFNGSSLSSGVYFYRLISGEFTNMKRMVIVK